MELEAENENKAVVQADLFRYEACSHRLDKGLSLGSGLGRIILSDLVAFVVGNQAEVFHFIDGFAQFDGDVN